jgi:hypothetical protein
MTIAKAAKHAHRKRESICIESLIRPWPHTSSQSLAANIAAGSASNRGPRGGTRTREKRNRRDRNN